MLLADGPGGRPVVWEEVSLCTQIWWAQFSKRKLSYTNTPCTRGGNEDYNVSNHIQFISRSFKQSSEPLDRLMKKRGNIAMKTLISVDLTHLCGKQLSITHACVTYHILLSLLMKHFD